MKTTLLIPIVLLWSMQLAQAQFLKKLGEKVVKTAERTIERKAEQKTEQVINNAADKIENAGSNTKDNKNQKSNTSSSSEKNKKKDAEVNVPYDYPQSTTKVSSGELIRWIALNVGQKFKEAEDKNLKQVIAVNPYLSPEKPMFGVIHSLQVAQDGSLIVAGTAGLDAEGGVKGIGWWKVAPDGAITSLISRPDVSPHPGIHPSENFSIASDGTILAIYTEEINTERVGTKIVRMLKDGKVQIVAEDLENPSNPVQDSDGNIWISNKNRTELLRISNDGSKSENFIDGRIWNNKELAPQERISLEYMAWDAVHKELVVGGSFITSKPHDLHSVVWRISPDGKTKRVFYNVKAGRSPIGQQTDAIRALTLDAKGQIILATAIMNDRARRQIARVNENTGKLDVLTGYSYSKEQRNGFSDYRPGHEEASYDGVAAHANFRETKNIGYGPDGTYTFLMHIK